MASVSYSGRVLLYPKLPGGKGNDKKKDDGPAVNDLSAFGCSLNSRAARRIKSAGQYIARQARFRDCRFITLTLPTLRWKKDDGTEDLSQFQSDSYYNKRLSMFLENLRKNYGLTSYVWVAERQEGKRTGSDGQPIIEARRAIHYHIFCQIPFKKQLGPTLSHYWSKLLQEFHLPASNCVDIITIKKHAGITDYMGKCQDRWRIQKKLSDYMVKQGIPGSQEMPILFYARVWGADRETSRRSQDFKIPVYWLEAAINTLEFKKRTVDIGETTITMYEAHHYFIAADILEHSLGRTVNPALLI